MFEGGLFRLALDDLHGQQVGEDRQGLVKRAAFVVALDQADGFEHGITSVNEFTRFYLTSG